jgi:hypothetical protein
MKERRQGPQSVETLSGTGGETEGVGALPFPRVHGEKKNRFLVVGTTVLTEANSYKGWRRGKFGKRTKVQAPGAFVALLRNSHAC